MSQKKKEKKLSKDLELRIRDRFYNFLQFKEKILNLHSLTPWPPRLLSCHSVAEARNAAPCFLLRQAGRVAPAAAGSKANAARAALGRAVGTRDTRGRSRTGTNRVDLMDS